MHFFAFGLWFERLQYLIISFGFVLSILICTAHSIVFHNNAIKFKSSFGHTLFGCFPFYIIDMVALWRFNIGQRFSTKMESPLQWYVCAKLFNPLIGWFKNEIIIIDCLLDATPQAVASVDCVINQEYSVSCIQDGDEVYVPFSFLRDYFEVYGSLSTVGKGPPKFEWSHSNAKINYPKGNYDPKGIFMYFENYNVEVMTSVRFLSLFTFSFWQSNQITISF